MDWLVDFNVTIFLQVLVANLTQKLLPTATFRCFYNKDKTFRMLSKKNLSPIKDRGQTDRVTV